MDLFEKKLKDRFLRYVMTDTRSDESSGTHPSSRKQFDLLRILKEELEKMGADEINVDDEHCYLYAKIFSNSDKILPKIGFIAHLDTSPEASGIVHPVLVEDYDGGDVGHLNVDAFPELKRYKGQTLIITDSTSLLGSDDKSGIAEIMTMAEFFLSHPEEEHGEIRIAFTPDEEIGEGSMFFDLDLFDADYAYTVDGGVIGEVSYENFNAASAKIDIRGRNVHPGEAFGKMINAARLAMEFDSMLPSRERPEDTRDHEGFFHLTDIEGDCSEARLSYIIRDHDRDLFEQKKSRIEEAAECLRKRYPDALIKVSMSDTYYNMKEKILPVMHIVDKVKESMESLGIEVLELPIRGGTDGATLSFKGLPCPNICAGGHNFHGIYEFVSLESMTKISRLLVNIASVC